MESTPGQSADTSPPPRSATFAEKMDYYRSQHTTRGIRATHLVGIPGAAFSIPVMLAKPKVGLPMFGLSWALQIFGHKVYEKNKPALTKGLLTYQFCGLAFWCEEMVDLIAGKGLARHDSAAAPRPQSNGATTSKPSDQRPTVASMS